MFFAKMESAKEGNTIREGSQAPQLITPATISTIAHPIGKPADIKSKIEKLYSQIKRNTFRQMEAKMVVKGNQNKYWWTLGKQCGMALVDSDRRSGTQTASRIKSHTDEWIE